MAGPPDAGQLLKEQKRRPELPRPLPEPEDRTEPAEPDAAEPRVLVKGFAFTGVDGLVTGEELQRVVSGALEKEHTFAGLESIAAQVTRYLKNRGWILARAYLPGQDVSSGIVTIAVSQGKSDGSLNIESDSTLRIREQRLRRMAGHGIRMGQPVKGTDLERAILLINDLPGISANASLSPGRDPGTSALTIKAAEASLFSGVLWGNNHGNRYTGGERGHLLLNMNDPLRIGDRLTFLLTGSRDLKSGELSYALPLSSDGLTGHLSYTCLEYALGKEFESLDGTGDARTADAGLTYPLLRTRKTSVYTSLAYRYTDLTDRVSDIDTSNRTLNSVDFSLSGDRYDAVFGGGLTRFHANAVFGDMDERTADIDVTAAQGRYTCFHLGLSRLQRLSQNFTLRLAWQAQFSRDNLDSSEQFALGGPYGIRAYPASEALGDEGHLFHLEIHCPVPVPEQYGRLKAIGFYDAGHITLHKDPWANAIDTATGKNRYWLQGAGVGLEYSFNEKLTIQGAWAHVLGDNDGRSTNGDDSDGKSSSSRSWLQVSWRF